MSPYIIQQLFSITVICSGIDIHLDLSIESLDLQFASKDSLCDGDEISGINIKLLPFEIGMRLNLYFDVQVAMLAIGGVVAFLLQTEVHIVINSFRHVDGFLDRDVCVAFAVAGHAGVSDHRALAITSGAHHVHTHKPLLIENLAGAAASGTLSRC